VNKIPENLISSVAPLPRLARGAAGLRMQWESVFHRFASHNIMILNDLHERFVFTSTKTAAWSPRARVRALPASRTQVT